MHLSTVNRKSSTVNPLTFFFFFSHLLFAFHQEEKADFPLVFFELRSWLRFENIKIFHATATRKDTTLPSLTTITYQLPLTRIITDHSHLSHHSPLLINHDHWPLTHHSALPYLPSLPSSYLSSLDSRLFHIHLILIPDCLLFNYLTHYLTHSP